MEERVLALTIAYDGGDFCGFARQPGLMTVQRSLEEALATALRRSIETVCAGRTDSGVHALGQVVTCSSLSTDPGVETLPRSLNALTPDSLVVRSARIAHPGFSSRYDAVRREYRYRIVTGPMPPVFLGRYGWWVHKELDLEAMREASKALLGKHDFHSFCVSKSAEGQRTVRRIDSLQIDAEEQLGEESLVVRICGKAFLHSMVRIVVGTLVEVGLGKRTPDGVIEALAAHDRAAAGKTAPPEGLTLWRVEYPDTVWL